MFCCESCPYKSNRKYNLNKHIKSVHKRDANETELVCKQITSENEQITYQKYTNHIPKIYK